MDKQPKLAKIAKKIEKDNVCPELRSTATQLVPGEGDPDAEIVFVGEAPGKEEDRQGRPFVGAAGRLLDQLLASIKLRREDVFITNIVKYRPPNNRDPFPAEISAFMPYLQQQIDVIDPTLIIPLGRHALSALLPDQRISQCHGQAKRKNGRVFLPLYHPAVALYNTEMKATLSEDFGRILPLLRHLNSPVTNKGKAYA